MRNLVIVESPAKAKTIEGYLGESFNVIASYGHVRDMEDKTGSVSPGRWSDIKWAVNDRGKTQLNQITTMAKNSDRLILATDPDREGEAIAWHICELLKKDGILDSLEVRRAVFNSVTQNAVFEAIENMREINQEKVQAYLARRVLDYVVGFNISPLLWRRLPGAKSAGRVQSVALKLICERENKRESFEPIEYWSIWVNLKKQDRTIKAQLNNYEGRRLKKFDIKNEEEAKNILSRVESSLLIISEINKKPFKRNPKPPFITSTLQQEAARKLKLSADQAMRIAQSLYATGYITYMRTDSPVISDEGITFIREVIAEKYGPKYLHSEQRVYKSKSKQAQEAHEAIRPTNVNKLPSKNDLNGEEKDLYELIWNRAVSSQMESANLTQTEVFISSDSKDLVFKATGSQVIFNGFLEVYEEGSDNEEESKDSILPKDLKVGDKFSIESATHEQHFTKPPPRYTEASLIKELEEKGIGRPSTYASIMNSIKRREYASLQNKQFHPASRGRVVVSFLDNYFSEYFKYDFTAEMEESLDLIARGELDWTNLLDKFWEGFGPNVRKVESLSNREILDKLNNSLSDQLFPRGNKCPKCTEGHLTLKNSPKFGPFIGCSQFDQSGCDFKRPPFLSKEDEDLHNKSKEAIGRHPTTGEEIFMKPSAKGGGFYLSMENKGENKRQTIPLDIVSEMTLEESIKWLQLPRKIGSHPDSGEIIEAGFARGPFVRVKRENQETYQYANIPANEDIFSLGMNRAVELLSGKGIQKEEPKILGLDSTSNLPVILKQGRFGAYLETDEFIRKAVPKDFKPEEITLDWAVDNLPIIFYHISDSRPVGIRRQRTKNKKWKAFIVHGEVKKEIPNDIKIKDINKEVALSILGNDSKEV